MILLANLVQPANRFRIACNPQLLALGEQELLIDQVAKQVALTLRQIGRRNVVFSRFLDQLLLAANQLRPRDDLVVYAHDHVLNDRSIRCDRRGLRKRLRLRRIGHSTAGSWELRLRGLGPGDGTRRGNRSEQRCREYVA